MFQHTAARRRLGKGMCKEMFVWECFNTQPPEGGWFLAQGPPRTLNRFNTQPPEGGWQGIPCTASGLDLFQHTAARRRLAFFEWIDVRQI